MVSVGNFCQAQGTPGCSYHPSHPQVECNSKLDPTNTTFLKVSGWQRGSRVARTACAVPVALCPSIAGCPHLPVTGLSWLWGWGEWGEQGGLGSSILPVVTRGQGGEKRRPPKLTRTFSLQMADSGGLPQVTQVSLPSFLSQLSILGPEAWTGAVPG